MLNTVLVDDEINSLNRLKEMLEEENRLDIKGSYLNPQKFLIDMKKQKLKLDLVFLDIEMPGIKGLLLAEKLLNIDESIDIVFVTAYNNYAVEAFELNALDYLLKPVTEERFRKTLDRFFQNKPDISTDTHSEFLKIKCLGEFNVYSSGKKIDPYWSTAKAEELFLYLLYFQGEFIAKEKIIDNLWSNSPADKAVDILYTTIYFIRKLFKDIGYSDLIKSKRGYYKLRINQIKCDMFKFEEMAVKYKEGKINISNSFITEIEKLYSGNYLQEKIYPWAYGYRIKLIKDYKYIINDIIDKLMENKQYKRAENKLKKLIKFNPLDESSHKKLIKLYKLCGNKKAAVAQYQEVKSILKKEFGVEPGFEL